MTSKNFEIPYILQSPIGVVCHDAGAANLILAWLKCWSDLKLIEGYEFRLLIKGPAEKEWNKSPLTLKNVKYYFDFQSLMSGAGCILTGTGWASSLEHDARKYANSLKIPCVAVIDHWVNYKERFIRDNEIVLPNEIWVSDPYAVEIVKSQIPEINIVELTNVYLNELIKNILPVKENSQILLYVTEPLRTDWGRNEEAEFQALDYFVKKRKVIIGDDSMNLVLRLHPSENKDKYISWIKRNSNLNPIIDKKEKLSDSISDARWVVGAETYALVVALSAKRDTWSSLPPWANQCRLPQELLKKLRDYD